MDPFGTAFDIYIDAPMLVLDETDALYTSGKLEKVAGVEGRYVYHVDASRTVEAQYGTNETKNLVFKTNGIVTAGEIIITADVFETNGGKLNEIVEARLRITQVTVLH